MNIRIYCGTYHKYNSGSLKGEWIDLTDFADKDEFYEYCAELHSDEDDPEFMFQNYEHPDIFGDMISEGGMDDQVFKMIEFFKNEGIDPDEDFLTLLSRWGDSYVTEDPDELLPEDRMECFRLGCHSSFNWSDTYFRFDGCGNIESTDYLERWIDWGVVRENLLREL